MLTAFKLYSVLLQLYSLKIPGKTSIYIYLVCKNYITVQKINRGDDQKTTSVNKMKKHIHNSLTNGKYT